MLSSRKNLSKILGALLNSFVAVVSVFDPEGNRLVQLCTAVPNADVQDVTLEPCPEVLHCRVVDSFCSTMQRKLLSRHFWNSRVEPASVISN